MLREFAEYKLLVYGGVLVAVMILRPEGLIPDAARRGELEDARTPGGGTETLDTLDGDAHA
jgi:branched-chain amino acid transport system permease protein